MPDDPDEIRQQAQQYLEQETPPFLFFFNPSAKGSGFDKRLERAYKLLWKDRLDTGETLLRQRDIITSEQADKISGIVRRLRSDLKYEVCRSRTRRYNNREVQPQGLDNVHGRTVDVVVQFSDPNDDLTELYLTLSMLRDSSASRINVLAPWLPYMRGDKKVDGKVPISAKEVFRHIEESAGRSMGSIVTLELHAQQEQGFADCPVDHLSAVPLFAQHTLSPDFLHKYSLSLDDITVLALDGGAVERSRLYSRCLGGLPLVLYDKTRPAPGKSKISGVVGQVKTRCAVIVEDMIDTGGSVEVVGNHVRKYSKKCKLIVVYAAHGIFSPTRDEKNPRKILARAEDILRRSRVKVITTDSIPRQQAYYTRNRDWLDGVLSTAPAFAQTALLRRLGYSVSQWMTSERKEILDTATAGGRYDISDYLVGTGRSTRTNKLDNS